MTTYKILKQDYEEEHLDRMTMYISDDRNRLMFTVTLVMPDSRVTKQLGKDTFGEETHLYLIYQEFEDYLLQTKADVVELLTQVGIEDIYGKNGMYFHIKPLSIEFSKEDKRLVIVSRTTRTAVRVGN